MSRIKLIAPLAILSGLLLPLNAQQSGSIDPYRAKAAELAQDVELLLERTGNLAIRVEQLERENARLKAALAAQEKQLKVGYVTVAQLNESISDLDALMRKRDDAVAERISGESAERISELARKTEAAMKGLANAVNAAQARPSTPSRSASANPVDPAVLNTKYPETGVPYTVQRGDTLSGIASKLNSKVAYIQAANQILDPTTLMAGETIFVPQDAD